MYKITKSVRLQLARLLRLAKEIQIADGRTLHVEGELQPGEEIFIADENGELQPAPDGIYTATDGMRIAVSAGIVESLTTAGSTGDEQQEAFDDTEDKEDDTQALKDQLAAAQDTIADLKGELLEKDTDIADLKDKIKELEEELQKPAADPIETEERTQKAENKFMKYAHAHQ